MLHPVHYARQLRKSATPAEKIMWNLVRRNALNGYKIDRQFPFIYGKKENGTHDFFVFDFYCHAAKLAIELDGDIHQEQLGYDKWRDDVVADFGILTWRIKNEDFLKDPKGELDKIAAIIKERLS